MPFESVKKEAPPSLATQSPEERERDSVALAEAEEARRTLFYRQCIEGNLDITHAHKDAIVEAMRARKTASWGSFDGKDVKFVGVEVREGLIVLTFDFFDGMNIVDEKIPMK